MGRARREKKKEGNSNIWIIIICLVVIFAIICFAVIRVHKGGEASNNEETNNTQLDEKNVTIDNVTNDIQDNNIVSNETTNETENTAESSVVEEEDNNTDTTTTSTLKSYKPTEPGITDKKQKAIELVKREWGEDDTVNYVFDYVNENGEYVIAVKDKETATVRNYFRVNLETETVDLD